MNRVAEPSLLSAAVVVKILIFPIISERFRSNPPMVGQAHLERFGKHFAIDPWGAGL